MQEWCYLNVSTHSVFICWLSSDLLYREKKICHWSARDVSNPVWEDNVSGHADLETVEFGALQFRAAFLQFYWMGTHWIVGVIGHAFKWMCEVIWQIVPVVDKWWKRLTLGSIAWHIFDTLGGCTLACKNNFSRVCSIFTILRVFDKLQKKALLVSYWQEPSWQGIMVFSVWTTSFA